MICFYWLLGYNSLKEFQYKQGHFELLCFVEVRLSSVTLFISHLGLNEVGKSFLLRVQYRWALSAQSYIKTFAIREGNCSTGLVFVALFSFLWISICFLCLPCHINGMIVFNYTMTTCSSYTYLLSELVCHLSQRKPSNT